MIIYLDDLGFSDIGPYGSEIRTPHLDRLTDRGVRFTNYHAYTPGAYSSTAPAELARIWAEGARIYD